MRRLLIIAMLGTAALAGCGKQPAPPKMPPPMVDFTVVREQPVTLSVELPGRTSPFAVSDVRPQVSGIIQKRLFVEGSAVKAGQALYQIDPAPYQAAYESAVATVASTRAKSERYATLLKQNAVSAQEADDALAAYKLAAANAQSARINLQWTHIVAPISGRIGASSVTVGALVSAQQATALATISTLDPIYVDIAQSSNELLALERAVQGGSVSQGGNVTAKVTLKLDDGSTYPLDGKLQFTDVTVEPTTGAVRLRAIFPNPKNLLLPGLYVRAVVTEGVDPHGILVPQAAVSHDQKGQPTAMVVDEKNIARLRVLKTGQAIDSQWQVLDGLKAGDKLITEGLMKAVPDAPVMAMPAGANPPAPAPAAAP